MKIVITTLSIGENYTRDYTCRLIQDVLNMSDLEIYITTDYPQIIKDNFGDNNRIIINIIKREDIKVRLKIGQSSDDFNFNLRYLCLEPLVELDNTIIIFTDCDNSFDWWNRFEVESFISEKYNDGFDFFAPRIDYKWKSYKEEFIRNNRKNEGIFWHKIYNYDLDLDKSDLDDSSLPAEYLVIFYNNNDKLRKFVKQWKYFHDYLVQKETTFGTWAEGFEIGASALSSGFNGYDISFNHSLWSKILVASGYKNGHKGNIIHPTER